MKEKTYRYLYCGERVDPRRSEAYTLLPDHIKDSYFDIEEGAPAFDVEELLAEWRTKPPCTVRWMVDHRTAAQVRADHDSADDYAARMDAQRKAQRDHFEGARIDRETFANEKIDRETFANDERIALCKSHVLPAMQKAGIERHGSRALEVVRAFREQHGEGSAERLRDVFRTAAPALELLAQIFASRALNAQRKTRRQDFWDTEHAGLAPVYADAFATLDGNLKEVLCMRAHRPPGARAAILGTIDELRLWADTAMPTRPANTPAT